MVDLPARAPEANPVMYLHITTTDDNTGQPVFSAIYYDNKLIADQVYALDLAFPSRANGLLEITAPGYTPAKLQLEYNIKSSRVMTIPVQLVPGGDF